MTRLCGHLCRPLKIYLLSKRSLFHSGGTRVRSNADHMGGSRLSMRRYICLARGACFTAGVPESGQTLTIWAGRALACARYTQDPNEERCRGPLDASGSAGVLSRGVGLRGFESHPPHQPGYPVSNCPRPGEDTPVRLASEEGRIPRKHYHLKSQTPQRPVTKSRHLQP